MKIAEKKLEYKEQEKVFQLGDEELKPLLVLFSQRSSRWNLLERDIVSLQKIVTNWSLKRLEMGKWGYIFFLSRIVRI